MNKIKEFQNEYRWLSNFWKSNMEIDGIIFPTNEHWYIYNKTNDKNMKEKILSIESPGYLKKFAKDNIKLNENWDQIKVNIMKKGLYAKFTQNEKLKQKLLNTNNMILEEGNKWGDRFWGINLNPKKGSVGTGKNILGKLLMELRKQLREEEKNKEEQKKKETDEIYQNLPSALKRKIMDIL